MIKDDKNSSRKPTSFKFALQRNKRKIHLRRNKSIETEFFSFLKKRIVYK